MRCFTIEEQTSLRRGLRVLCPSEAGGVRPFAAVPLEDPPAEVEGSVTAHLLRCQAAFAVNAAGERHEQADLPQLDQVTAKRALNEVEAEGWLVDHLAPGSDDMLRHSPDNGEEGPALVLVAPLVDEGGHVEYHVPPRSPIEALAGEGDWRLLLLPPGTELALHRVGCSSGWQSLKVRWTGKALVKERCRLYRREKAA